MWTYKWNVSLYFGIQVLLLLLVVCLRFLSLRWGPHMANSTYGRNIPVVRHFKPLAATTLTVTLCSPVPGWVNKSTWIETSPKDSSNAGRSKSMKMNDWVEKDECSHLDLVPF